MDSSSKAHYKLTPRVKVGELVLTPFECDSIEQAYAMVLQHPGVDCKKIQLVDGQAYAYGPGGKGGESGDKCWTLEALTHATNHQHHVAVAEAEVVQTSNLDRRVEELERLVAPCK